MSNKDNLPQQNEEDVDLGKLFSLIGNMFLNLFKFIGNIFKGIFKVFILLLIHLYRGLKWYVMAVVIGVIVGFILDSQSNKVYGAHLYIETNFGSVRQVYENIRNLDILASRDIDSVELGKILGMEVKHTSNLKGFFIEPNYDENEVIQQFSEYKFELDSLSKFDANYKDYKENLEYYNFPIHKIRVIFSTKDIHPSFRKNLTTYLTKNEYLENLKDRIQLNLDMESVSLEKQTTKLDSLTQEYLKIRVRESNKELVAQGSGTNLYMAGSRVQNNLLINESNLLEKRYALEERKREIELEKLEKQEIINILSEFPKSGYDISEWHDKMKFKLPIILFVLIFIGSLLLLLKNYIKEQSELLESSQE